MNDGFAWWLIVLGIAIGVGLVWVFVVRLPRSELDVEAPEMPIEADWISRNIESYGGIAPQPLVEEVLELHRQYLTTGPTPLPPTWRPSANGHEPEVRSGLRPEQEPAVASGLQSAPEAAPESAPEAAPESAPEADTGSGAVATARYARPAEDPTPAEAWLPSAAPPTPASDELPDHT
jgi:hypothetical protein